jgi:hypothetical protein
VPQFGLALSAVGPFRPARNELPQLKRETSGGPRRAGRQRVCRRFSNANTALKAGRNASCFCEEKLERRRQRLGLPRITANPFGTLRDSASHIWIAGGNSAARCSKHLWRSG